LDEYSHFGAIFPVKSKAEIPAIIVNLFKYWQTQLGKQILAIRCDRGTEFQNQSFKSYCEGQGIKIETSAPYTPQQNGKAERLNRTLKEKTKTLLLHAKASPALWREAALTAVQLYNLTPVAGQSVTPYEAFFGSKPFVGHLRVWGSKVFVLLPEHQQKALGPRSVPGIMVGYEPGSKAYRVLVGGAIRVSRDVRFLEGNSTISSMPFDAPCPSQSPPVYRPQPFKSQQPSGPGEASPMHTCDGGPVLSSPNVLADTFPASPRTPLGNRIPMHGEHSSNGRRESTPKSISPWKGYSFLSSGPNSSSPWKIAKWRGAAKEWMVFCGSTEVPCSRGAGTCQCGEEAAP
jgi:hypothetical protein